MVTVATNLGRNGLQDWLIQRVSAVILALYILFLLSFWIFKPDSYLTWQHLLQFETMRYFTFFALLALIAHSWIGVWTIATDYIKLAALRLLTLILVYILLVFYVIWGIQILWG